MADYILGSLSLYEEKISMKNVFILFLVTAFLFQSISFGLIFISKEKLLAIE